MVVSVSANKADYLWDFSGINMITPGRELLADAFDHQIYRLKKSCFNTAAMEPDERNIVTEKAAFSMKDQTYNSKDPLPIMAFHYLEKF